MAEHSNSSFDDDEKTAFKAFVGIDFGTDGSGLAYCLPDGSAYIHNLWDDTTASQKPKTSVLFDGANNTLRVGSKAQDMYLNCSGDQGWKLFERFKMNLYEEPTSKEALSPAECKMEFVDLKEKISSTNNKEIQEYSSRVFIAELSYLKEQAFIFIDLHLSKKLSLVGDKESGFPEIQYFLTVPAIWSDRAKDKMMNWAKEAGLINGKVPNQLRIVYEPDCAALSIQHAIVRSVKNGGQNDSAAAASQNEAVKSGKSKKKKKGKELDSLQPQIGVDVAMETGDKYILLDVGGGTCDVACHEILGDFAVAEVLHPSGGKWGATYIDERFTKLLSELFTSDLLDVFQMSEKGGRTSYLSFVAHFLNEAKISFYEKPSRQYHDIEMPSTFVTFVANQYNRDFNEGDESLDIARILIDLNAKLEKVGRRHKYKAQPVAAAANAVAEPGGANNPTDVEGGGDADEDEISKRDWMIKIIDSDEGMDDEYEEDHLLSIHCDVWMMMFDTIVDPIIAHCKRILAQPQMKDTKYMFAVGGFASSKYFQLRLHQEFKAYKKLSVVLPDKPGLCVVDGAARYGLKRGFVKIRRLAMSYGVIMNCVKSQIDPSKLPAGYADRKENTFYDAARQRDYIRNWFCAFVHRNQAITIGKTALTHSFGKQDKDQTRCSVPIYSSTLVEPMLKSDGKRLGAIYVEVPRHSDDGIEVEFSFASNLLTVVAYPKGHKNKQKQCKVEYY